MTTFPYIKHITTFPLGTSLGTPYYLPRYTTHIVEAYLDDFTTHSCKRAQHLLHLRLVLERCRHYQIHLNPHKCIFCAISGFLLGFIVSIKGIMVDPLKVEAITQLPPSHTIHQLQSLQGKVNFLRRSVPNYANIKK